MATEAGRVRINIPHSGKQRKALIECPFVDRDARLFTNLQTVRIGFVCAVAPSVMTPVVARNVSAERVDGIDKFSRIGIVAVTKFNKSALAEPIVVATVAYALGGRSLFQYALNYLTYLLFSLPDPFPNPYEFGERAPTVLSSLFMSD